MTISEAAKQGIARVSLLRNGQPAWNPYSFAEIYLVRDGLHGPWLTVYDPCGCCALGIPCWTPLMMGVWAFHKDQFQPFIAPPDMEKKFPGMPPVAVQK